MKKTFAFFLVFFILTDLFGFYKSNNYCSHISLDTKADSMRTIKKDTIKVVLLQNSGNNTGFDWQKNMPWIGAIIVGILTIVANILINQRSRKTNLEVTKTQIDNAKEIALAQIETSRDNFKMEFNKTVLSGNRQTWINDLRESVSKVLTKVLVLSAKKDFTPEEYEELKFQLVKTELMLNETKDKEFIELLKEVEHCCIYIASGEKKITELKNYTDRIKNLTKQTLKTEWERVKKGE
jgi:hypothetical protein